MKKKIFSVILAVFMFAAVFTPTVGAEDEDYEAVGSEFADGMKWVRKGGKYGFINESGNIVVPVIYDAVYCEYSGDYIIPVFSEGLAAVVIDGKCGFIDKTCEFVIPAIYDGNFFRGEWVGYIPKFCDGLARVRQEQDGKFGYIDKSGNVAVNVEYEYAGNSFTGEFTEGLIRVCKDDKWGFVDKSGNIIVPIDYDYVLNFSNGLAPVTYDSTDKWGFIDKTGKLVLPIEYYIGDAWTGYAYFNDDGYAIVRTGSVWNNNGTIYYGVIDRKGNVVVPYEYYRIEFTPEGLIQGQFNDSNEWIILEARQTDPESAATPPKTGDSLGGGMLMLSVCSVIVFTGVIIQKKLKKL